MFCAVKSCLHLQPFHIIRNNAALRNHLVVCHQIMNGSLDHVVELILAAMKVPETNSVDVTQYSGVQQAVVIDHDERSFEATKFQTSSYVLLFCDTETGLSAQVRTCEPI